MSKMLSIEETRALSQVDPEFEPIINSGSPYLAGWTLQTDIHQIRAIIAKMRQAQVKPDPATLSYTQEDLQVPLRDGATVTARVYRPKETSEEKCPGLIIFHGGGFVVGDLETEAGICALFTSLGGVAVNVDYRHAPEYPFPTPVQDAYDGTKWAVENASKLGIDPSKGLIVGGESAGADLALAVAYLYREDGLSPSLTGIFAPITNSVNEETVPDRYRDHFISLEQNSQAPMLKAESIQLIRKLYKPDLKSPLASPLAYSDHSGIPKTYFQACGLDPARDSSLVLEQVYRDEGIPTKLDVYPGLPHGFWGLFPQLKAAAKHEKDTLEGLKWLLEK